MGALIMVIPDFQMRKLSQWGSLTCPRSPGSTWRGWVQAEVVSGLFLWAKAPAQPGKEMNTHGLCVGWRLWMLSGALARVIITPFWHPSRYGI